MTATIIENIRNFRKKLFSHFVYRAETTMDLIDAIAGQVSKESVVKLSLCNLFRRKFSSITNVVDNLFRREANKNPKADELEEDQMKITKLIAEQCPSLTKRSFHLFAVDCSSDPSIYAEKMEDRGFVHSPTKVPGQKPITVGHQYSTLVYLPEKSEDPGHWVIPLSSVRVKSKECSTFVGMKQLAQVVTETRFKDTLCLAVCDSAYSHVNCTRPVSGIENLVCASRIRNNRTFHCKLQESKEPKKRGRPKIYGKRWDLRNPGEADECTTITHVTASGKTYSMRVERWNERLDRGSPQKNKGLEVEAVEFDAIRVTMLKPNGEPLYKKPLWIMVTGERRREICIIDIANSYLQRYDIEHFFRFGKQKLLLTTFQTSDVRHEENWWWLCIISYMMLYMCRSLGDEIRNPWERKEKKTVSKVRTPTQVQRSYEGIIREIGTPAHFPKLRGKSPGRAKGIKMLKKRDCPIVKKTTNSPKDEDLAAA